MIDLETQALELHERFWRVRAGRLARAFYAFWRASAHTVRRRGVAHVLGPSKLCRGDVGIGVTVLGEPIQALLDVALGHQRGRLSQAWRKNRLGLRSGRGADNGVRP